MKETNKELINLINQSIELVYPELIERDEEDSEQVTIDTRDSCLSSSSATKTNAGNIRPYKNLPFLQI